MYLPTSAFLPHPLPLPPAPTRHPAPIISLTSPPPTRRKFLQAVLAAIALSAHPPHASAVCGQPDPFNAHYLDWEEALAETPDARHVHFRRIGSKRKEHRAASHPVLYLGDAGATLASGETLELLANTNRRVLLVDYLGVGDSDRLPDRGPHLGRDAALAMASFDILAALREANIASGRNKGDAGNGQLVHVVAAGFGIQVAAHMVATGVVGDGGDVRFASVAAEGWGAVSAGREDVTFSALGGGRACMVEAGERGDVGLMRALYMGSKAGSGVGFEAAVRGLSDVIPTLGLRTSDVAMLGEKWRGALYEEVSVEGAGRLAHLSNTNECLNTLVDFFSKVEGKS